MSSVARDERTVVVEDASYRLAYLFISFALLLDVAVRGLVKHEASWDLLAVVILAGAISTAYQGWRKVLSRRTFRVAAATFVVAGIVAALIAALRLVK